MAENRYVAQNLRQAATPAEAPETRSFGFQSNVPGGPAERAAANRAPDLATAATELGAPTSYKGGAGAPMPVEVVRGTRTTYTNPAPSNEGGGYNPNPSQNTREYGSPLQARQAFNRGANIGEYVSPEGPKLQAAADIVKSVDPSGARAVNLATAAASEAALAKTGLADETTAYRKSFLGDHGVYDPKGIPGMPTEENLSRIYQRGAGLVQGGMPATDAYQAIQPDIQKHYYTPENVDRALTSISQRTGQPITPAWRANAMSGSPEAMSALYPEIRSTLRQPKPGFWGSAGKSLTTNTDPFATAP